jgi:hypothetical protein
MAERLYVMIGLVSVLFDDAIYFPVGTKLCCQEVLKSLLVSRALPYPHLDVYFLLVDEG